MRGRELIGRFAKPDRAAGTQVVWAEELMPRTELDELQARAARWQAMQRRITDNQAVAVLAVLVARIEERIAQLETDGDERPRLCERQGCG